MEQELLTTDISAFDYLFGEEIRVKDEVERNGYAISEPILWLFDKNALKVQPKPLWRIDLANKRYYYTFLDMMNTVPKFFISVTSSIASLNLLPTNFALIEWYSQFPTFDIAKEELQKLADYGTFDHAIIGQFWKKGKMDLEGIPDLVDEYKLKNQLRYDNRFWIKYVRRDLIALDKWSKEHEVRPIAIELMLCGKDGYATMVDFICEMTVGTGRNGIITAKDRKEGTCQRVWAIVDWKSMMSFTKHKSFHKTNEFQLEACRRLVVENFPELKIDRLFNISFEGSIRSAEVIMKEQTDKALRLIELPNGTISTEFDLYWEIFKINNPDWNEPRDFDEIKGYVDLKRDAYQINPRNIKEIVIEKHRKFKHE